MRRKIVIRMLLLFCVLAFAGCGREVKEEEPETEEIVPTGEYAPIADFTSVRVDMPSLARHCDCVWIGDEIFYLERDWNKERDINDSYVYAVSLDGTGTPRVVVDNMENDDSYIYSFFFDNEGMLYLFEYNRDMPYSLRKIDMDGNELFRTSLDEAFPPKSHFSIGNSYVDNQGNIALMDSVNNQVVFLDSQGQYRNTAYAELGSMSGFNVVEIEESGSYLWAFDWSEEVFCLQELDFEKGLVAEKITLETSSLAETSNAIYGSRLIGGELGLLVSTRDILWQYDLETKEAVEYLHWNDANINVDGRYVAQICFGGMEEGQPAMDVLIYDEYLCPQAEIATVHYIDKAYIKKRETFTLGIDSPYSSNKLDSLVRKFNRMNNGYAAVLVEYDVDGLKEALAYGKEVPDLLDVSNLRTEWLESKDLLENLTPYFKKSEIVSKEDILPRVWEILENKGKITRMATSFKIGSLVSAADLPADGWTYEQFFALQEQYPESWYIRAFYPLVVWRYISQTATNEFIDWNKGKCCFDSEEFKEILEKMSNIKLPPDSQMSRTYYEDELLRELMSQKYLILAESFGSPYRYDRLRTQSGGKAKCVGYPTVDGEAAYLFEASQEFAIYANSSCKDGAWAFIEYLLSEDAQTWYGSEKDVFPVRAGAFEEYLTRKHMANTSTMADAIPSEDTPDELHYMVDHLWQGQTVYDEVNDIIEEEIQAYLAGDKTVDEVAKIIQNRVQLYLDEM